MSQDKTKFLNDKFTSATSAISNCLRGFMVPSPGKVFIGCDYSAIESRVICWVTNQKDILDEYKGEGKVYEKTAADIYAKPMGEINTFERLVGKVAELALGFQGGRKALQRMAQAYGLSIEESEGERIKVRWRESRPRIVSFWDAVEQAAIRAVENKGQAYTINRGNASLLYKTNGSFLWTKLPSGRLICYPYPVVDEVATPWGDFKPSLFYKGVDSYTNKWSTQSAYGGLLTENVVQAIARDLLADAIVRLEEKGYDIVLHIHDEIVIEASEDTEVSTIEEIMCDSNDWATGLPVKAEGWKGVRYQK